MKLKNLAVGATALALTACSSQQSADKNEEIIGKPEYHSSTGVFDIDALEALGRVSDPQVSPDGKKVLYGISYESLKLNKSNREPLADGRRRQ